jgi:hypothetical protein
MTRNAFPHLRRALGLLAALRILMATTTLIATTTLLLAASPADADAGSKIIDKCTHGQSLSGFSQQAYRKALQELPTEVDEYSDCSELIQKAQLAAAGGRASQGANAGSTAAGAAGGTGFAGATKPITPTERRALNHDVRRAGSAPIKVGNQIVHPGVVHANIASAFSSLPTPLLTILAFLLACILLIAGGAIRNRVRARRSD